MSKHQTNVPKAFGQLTMFALLLTNSVLQGPQTFGQGLIPPTPALEFGDSQSPGGVPAIPEGFEQPSGDFGAAELSGLLIPGNESTTIADSSDFGLIAPNTDQPIISAPTFDLPHVGASESFMGSSYFSTRIWKPTNLQRFGYQSPVRISFFGGESYAEPAPFVAFDIFRPLDNQNYQDDSELLRYFDGRLGVSTEGGGFLANIGAGQRIYMPTTDCIIDINAWYDVDSTRDRVFQQIAGGGQIQNQNLLLRGHYYFPIGHTEKTVGFSEFTGNSVFEGNNLALERFREEEQAFKGYDVEAGVFLPLCGHVTRLFVGYYNFEAENAAPLAGYSSTLNFDPIPNLTVAFQLTYDEDTHDTGYLLSASYDFYKGPRDPAPNIRHRLGETVRRNRHIVSRRHGLYDPEMAADANGNPLNFIHVSNAGNSNGTYENPYANLSQAAADALTTPNSIIIAHADSIFDGQSIALPAETRFLGEGIDHQIVTPDTQLGTVALPRATAGAAIPIIRNSPATSPAISLASNSEVSGFRIENSGGTALFGSGLSGETSILNTTVAGATTGLHLLGNAGVLTAEGLSISNTSGSGIWIEGSTSNSAITFADTLSISDAGSHGIHFDRNSNNSSVTFSGTVEVANTGTHGIFFDDNGDSSAATFDAAVSVSGAAGSGVVVSNLDTTTGTATEKITFTDSLTISNTGQSGLSVNLNDSNLTIQTLAISNWTASAISSNGNSGNLVVIDPVVLDNINGSLAPTLNISGSSGATTFGDVTITDTSRTAAGQATVNLFLNNTETEAITFNTLNVASTFGTALFGQDAGTTSKLIIQSGTISAVGGSAVALDTISTDVTLQSVSASNAAVGVSLINVGDASALHTKFQIVGDSTTPGSGGTISGVQTGILVDGTPDVSLQLLNVDSTETGVLARANGVNQPENLTVNALTLTDGGATADWIGIDVDWNNGAHTGDANVFSNNRITGTGADQIGLRIDNNQSNSEMQTIIGGNIINLTGLNSTGISMNTLGVSPAQTSNSGGIALTTSLDNIINATATPFISTLNNGAEITGQIRVNGVLRP